jgi:hypothetical protein
MSESLVKYSEMNLNREYFTTLTNHENLNDIESLQLQINSMFQSVSDISTHLTGLHTLILDGSILQSIRDFGIQFQYLQFLSVNHCGLTDLEGIASLPRLKEFHAADNHISELASVGFLDYLEVSPNLFPFLCVFLIKSILIYTYIHICRS